MLRLGQRLAPYGQLFQLGGGLVHGRLHFQQAGRPGGTAVREVGAQQVAFGGYGGEVGAGVDEVLGVFESADYDDAAQEAVDGRHEVRGTADKICRVGLPGCCGSAAACRAPRLSRAWMLPYPLRSAAVPVSSGTPASSRAARPASCLRSRRIASAAADGEVTARASAAAPKAAASGTS